MNLPNKLTMFRVILIPFFLVFILLGDKLSCSYLIASGIFVIASLTDLLDGKIARKYNLVTDFGKFMDPMADKLLVSAALIVFAGFGIMPSWVIFVMIGREFVISGFRLIAAEKGVVIAAGKWGKFKTASQMVMCIFVMFHLDKFLWASSGFELYKTFDIIKDVLMYICLALSIISLLDYLIRNRKLLADK